MHHQLLEALAHDHDFALATQSAAERRTRIVIAITAAMMVAELAAGYFAGSMALLADGWHMGTHAAALGIAAFAYAYSRRHAKHPRFTFGTGKVGFLGGYTSAVILAVVALGIAWESLQRLVAPVPVRFDEALVVAGLGLLVNFGCALILGGHGHSGHQHHEPGHGGHHQHDHPGAGRDQNLRAAYLHVVADAVTSITAIVALLAGKYLGWVWMDPATGLLGAVIIAKWSVGLMRDTSRVLLDAAESGHLIERIRRTIESDSDARIADFHLWRVGPAGHACIVSLATHQPRPAEYYRGLVGRIPGIEHITIEVNACPGDHCPPDRTGAAS